MRIHHTTAATLAWLLGLTLCVFSQPILAENIADASTDASQAQLQPLVTYHEAMSYLLGRNGKPKSAEKAAELFQLLAEKNWTSAQQMLGHLYFEGKGVEQNNLLAYKWFSLAARNNSRLTEDYSSRRHQLQSQIPADTLHQMDQWIAEWQPES
jgi:TPR repeat protein